jgi:hypothetical protein
MKKINLAIMFFALLAALFATQVTLTNIHGPTTTFGTFAVFQPNGTFAAYAPGASISLDNANQKVNVIATSVTVLDTSFVVASASQTQPLPAPTCKLLYVSWNGLTMSPTIDYTVTSGVSPANGTLAFVAGNPVGVGDTIRVTCFQ